MTPSLAGAGLWRSQKTAWGLCRRVIAWRVKGLSSVKIRLLILGRSHASKCPSAGELPWGFYRKVSRH